MELTEIIDMIAVVNDMAEIEKIEIEIGEAKLTIVKEDNAETTSGRKYHPHAFSPRTRIRVRTILLTERRVFGDPRTSQVRTRLSKQNRRRKHDKCGQRIGSRIGDRRDRDTSPR